MRSAAHGAFLPIKSWPASPPADLCLHALAVVMIYQAIDHLNFAQGEMAMFSTFMSWQLMQWACRTGPPCDDAGIVRRRRIADRAVCCSSRWRSTDLTNVAGFIALYAIINSVAGLIWDFTISNTRRRSDRRHFSAAS